MDRLDHCACGCFKDDIRVELLVSSLAILRFFYVELAKAVGINDIGTSGLEVDLERLDININ